MSEASDNVTLMTATDEKVCTTCGDSKALEDFYVHPTMAERRLNSCKECRKAYSRAWNKAGYGRQSKYGLTPERYAEMLTEQENACAICGKEFPEMFGVRGPHVDHDHASGEVRGLVCSPCNARLGWFEKRRTHILNYLGFLPPAY